MNHDSFKAFAITARPADRCGRDAGAGASSSTNLSATGPGAGTITVKDGDARTHALPRPHSPAAATR